jgi:DNA-binding LytR/AlgR family response regulator
MAADLFSLLAYDMSTARNGIKVLDLLPGSWRNDVLFSDMVMPRIPRTELATRKGACAAVKIIQASRYAAKMAADGRARLDLEAIFVGQIVKTLGGGMRQGLACVGYWRIR